MATETIKNNEYSRTFFVNQKDFNHLMNSRPVEVKPSQLMVHFLSISKKEQLSNAEKFMESKKSD
ncbi:hypothetical protein [Sporolactobacillus sp. THM19-2]|uniref:hypothetical protein n=1 Tax=Sporolactobacillus sp. THM19-2 TaxID=2511171 RepID=UPI00102183B3|nr:hypothetical protein [Sporolactobacillus sp. THM19-2]RYL93653.1 hypothetical protein EWH91_04190 [Sporolactobacillus sp. THM19-2]